MDGGSNNKAASWTGSKHLKKELKEILGSKPPASARKVATITKLAIKHVKYHKHVVQQIEKFLSSVLPPHRISGLYILDSIIKNAETKLGKENAYRERFSQNIASTVENVFGCLDADKVVILSFLYMYLFKLSLNKIVHVVQSTFGSNYVNVGVLVYLCCLARKFQN